MPCSIFGSIKDKMSRRNSGISKGPSPSPNPTLATPSPSMNPFATSRIPMGTDRSTQPPPPPYSEVAPAAELPGSSTQKPIITAPSPAPSEDDKYAFLATFDTIFLIDDSGSMAGRSWSEVADAVSYIAPICTARDVNGIDVYFLNARGSDNPEGGFCNIKRTDQVTALFHRVRPSGATPTGTRINQILRPYLRHYEREALRTGRPDDCGVKPVNMIVITDGVPTDDPEAVIVNMARKLDKLDAPAHQIGIQFFQVGNERGAAAALKELDDGLAEQGGGVRDMVDTVTWDARSTSASANALSGEAILKVVLGAVVRRLDRRSLDGSRAAGRSRDRLAP